jgi:hypothetical protein
MLNMDENGPGIKRTGKEKRVNSKMWYQLYIQLHNKHTLSLSESINQPSRQTIKNFPSYVNKEKKR